MAYLRCVSLIFTWPYGQGFSSLLCHPTPSLLLFLFRRCSGVSRINISTAAYRTYQRKTPWTFFSSVTDFIYTILYCTVSERYRTPYVFHCVAFPAFSRPLGPTLLRGSRLATRLAFKSTLC